MTKRKKSTKKFKNLLTGRMVQGHRMMDGEKFNYSKTTTTKKRAKENAKSIRSGPNAQRARVTKEKGGYNVWVGGFKRRRRRG